MRTPETRERAAQWWSIEENEGKAALEDEGVRKAAKGMGLGYDDDESVLRVNVKKGLEGIMQGVIPSEHWLKESR